MCKHSGDGKVGQVPESFTIKLLDMTSIDALEMTLLVRHDTQIN
jgi:hypothetical protein